MSGAALVDGSHRPDGRGLGRPAVDATTDARVEVGSGLTLVLRGRPLEASDQSLLTAYAAHFAVLEERRRAQADAARTQELAEGNRTKTALLAAVSHDLRTPLAAIKAAPSSLRNTAIAWSDEDREELLATVEESADRLDALVANLLDMSRLQTGSITSLSAEVDLASVAEWTLRAVPGAESIVVDRARRPAAGVRRSGPAGAGDRQRGRERAQAHRRRGDRGVGVGLDECRVGPAGQPAGGRPGTGSAGRVAGGDLRAVPAARRRAGRGRRRTGSGGRPWSDGGHGGHAHGGGDPRRRAHAGGRSAGGGR